MGIAGEDATALVKHFWEQSSCGTWVSNAPKYSREYFEEIEAHRYTVEPFIHAFAQFPRWHGKTVLEVGVGAGTDFLQWVRSGAKAHGVDLTEESIRNVTARLNLYGLKAASLQRCNAETLPFPDNHFDLAYSWGVIHHADDTEAILNEMVRVTKPGGTVKVMVYSKWCFWSLVLWLRYGSWRLRGMDWTLRHFQESYGTKGYTPATIRTKLLRSIAYENLRLSSYDQLPRANSRLRRLQSLMLWASPPLRHMMLCFEFTKPRV